MALFLHKADALGAAQARIAESPLPAEAKQGLQQCAWSGDHALQCFAVMPAVRRSPIAKDLKAALKTADGRAVAERIAVWTLVAQAFFATYKDKDACKQPFTNARKAIALRDTEFAILLRLVSALAGPADTDPLTEPGVMAVQAMAEFAGTSLNWMARAATGHPLVDDELAGLSGDAGRERLPEEYIQLRSGWQHSISQGVRRRQERMDAGRL
jgi:hypothetical protein